MSLFLTRRMMIFVYYDFLLNARNSPWLNENPFLVFFIQLEFFSNFFYLMKNYLLRNINGVRYLSVTFTI
jgi:hypothetical protein